MTKQGLCYCGEMTSLRFASLWECQGCKDKRKIHEDESNRLMKRSAVGWAKSEVRQTQSQRMFDDDWNKPYVGRGESLIALEAKLKTL